MLYKKNIILFIVLIFNLFYIVNQSQFKKVFLEEISITDDRTESKSKHTIKYPPSLFAQSSPLFISPLKFKYFESFFHKKLIPILGKKFNRFDTGPPFSFS